VTIFGQQMTLAFIYPPRNMTTKLLSFASANPNPAQSHFMMSITNLATSFDDHT
jgi:hypothetical protein